MTTLAYKINLPHSFAATYNCSSYGAGSYNSSQVCGATTTTAGGTGSTASGGSSLVNTGVHVVLPIIVGVALIATAAVLLFRKSKKPLAE